MTPESTEQVSNAQLAEAVFRELANESVDDSIRLSAAYALQSTECPNCGKRPNGDES